MELSPSLNYCPQHPIKRRGSEPPQGATAEKAVPSSVPLFDGKPLVAHIEATNVPRTGHAHAPEDNALLGFLPGTRDGWLSRATKGGSK